MSVLHTDQTTFKIVGNKDLEKHALCHIISIDDITDSKVYECSKKKRELFILRFAKIYTACKTLKNNYRIFKKKWVVGYL